MKTNAVTLQIVIQLYVYAMHESYIIIGQFVCQMIKIKVSFKLNI